MLWCICTSLVRPHLGYSIPVWNPHYQKDEVLLVKVQRRFTELFDDLRSMEYRLDVLKLWSLKGRCHHSDLTELLKWLEGFLPYLSRISSSWPTDLLDRLLPVTLGN